MEIHCSDSDALPAEHPVRFHYVIGKISGNRFWALNCSCLYLTAPLIQARSLRKGLIHLLDSCSGCFPTPQVTTNSNHVAEGFSKTSC